MEGFKGRFRRFKIKWKEKELTGKERLERLGKR